MFSVLLSSQLLQSWGLGQAELGGYSQGEMAGNRGGVSWSLFFVDQSQPDWGQRMPPFSLAANGGWYTCSWAKDLGGQPAVGAGGTGLKLCILVPICPK